MFTFDPRAYGPPILGLLETEPLCPLGPGKADESKRKLLASLGPNELFSGRAPIDLDMARCCQAGLWLLFDFLSESHALSQEIDTPSGSYWHGILHRREGDYDNAKYWFRHVARHEVFEPLGEAAAHLAQLEISSNESVARVSFLWESPWDPFRFVDLCRRADADRAPETLCRKVAQAEWRLLFDFCYRRSIG